ncbi:hypothetical protein BCR34DRAFT_600434 [Clohesyomyces aquaticus]|uniref:C2H2-type domain-containing protein n=1 Tax=Clohesyomyces aquaticus TaxID=1231657 RepID=A0A1Y1ZR56_9PLEO|nr:hypothetical protein BCR34DRAFT_600434 [Clohesyomyces aquaticus]
MVFIKVESEDTIVIKTDPADDAPFPGTTYISPYSDLSRLPKTEPDDDTPFPGADYISPYSDLSHLPSPPPDEASFKSDLPSLPIKDDTFLGCWAPGCKELFPSLSELKEHYVTAHTNILVPICPVETCICKTPFMHASEFESHMHTEHAGCTLRCTICSQTLTTVASWKNHIRVHSGAQKMWKCGHCDQIFDTRKEYMACMSKHHKDRTRVKKKLLSGGG